MKPPEITAEDVENHPGCLFFASGSFRKPPLDISLLSHGRTENTNSGSTEKAENRRKYRKPSGEHRTYAFPNIRTVRLPKAAEEATAHVRSWDKAQGDGPRGENIYLHCFMKHSL